MSRITITDDNDMLDFTEAFIAWVEENYNVSFANIGDSEHVHITYSLGDILKDYTVPQEEPDSGYNAAEQRADHERDMK